MRIVQTTTRVLASALYILVTALVPPELAETDTSQSTQPTILFDLGHNNYGANKADQTFYGFLRDHGFAVRNLHGPITDSALDGIIVFHTSNALARINIDNWSLPNPSAFTPDEIAVLLEWVQRGGSLLMVIEHMPFGGSYNDLARAIGFEVSNGFAVDSSLLDDYSEENIAEAGALLFRRGTGEISDHLIVTGQSPYGQIEHLATDCGSAIRLPSHAASLITLGADVVSLEPATSWAFTVDTPRRSVAGWSQAGVLEYGEGRIAVLGDNFLISAPGLLDPPYIEIEQEAELGAHNHKFTLNLYRWLSGQEDLFLLQ